MREAKDQDSADGKADTEPLPRVEPFAEDKECSDECPHGTRRLHRTDNRQRQMLERYISKDPTAENDKRFEDCEHMRPEVQPRHVKRRIHHHFRIQTRQQQRYRQDQRGETDAQREHINHLVVAERNLLADVIKAQAKGGYEG